MEPLQSVTTGVGVTYSGSVLQHSACFTVSVLVCVLGLTNIIHEVNIWNEFGVGVGERGVLGLAGMGERCFRQKNGK
jgi:hypothetical protein